LACHAQVAGSSSAICHRGCQVHSPFDHLSLTEQVLFSEFNRWSANESKNHKVSCSSFFIFHSLVDSINHFIVRNKTFHVVITQSNDNVANNTQEEEQEQQPHNPGLKTNLKPTKINLSARREDDETKRFVPHLEKELLKQALDKN